MKEQNSIQAETKALSISDVMAMLPDDDKIREFVSSRSHLYTAYSVKDRDGKYRSVIDVDSVVELLRDVLGN